MWLVPEPRRLACSGLDYACSPRQEHLARAAITLSLYRTYARTSLA